jgi:cytosine/adenosine deaminase-related metal-dependent hydrolase
MLEYAQRLSLRRRNAIAPRGTSTGRHLFERALAGGAQALDLGPAGIVAGARADFVVLDPDHASFAARRSDRLLDSLVFAGARDAIREVWSLGRRVVADGRHVGRETIARRFKATLARLTG